MTYSNAIEVNRTTVLLIDLPNKRALTTGLIDEAQKPCPRRSVLGAKRRSKAAGSGLSTLNWLADFFYLRGAGNEKFSNQSNHDDSAEVAFSYEAETLCTEQRHDGQARSSRKFQDW
jgi:hypothetical protein